jgi:hypothetical protein
MIDRPKQSRRVAFVAVLATAAMLFGPYSVAQNERTKGTIIGGAVGGVVGGGRGVVAGAVAGNLVGAVVKKERQQRERAEAAAQTRNEAAPAAEGAATTAPSPQTEDAAPSPANVVAAAAPLLHHTCASLVAARGGDEEAIRADIAAMAALSVQNRGLDLMATSVTEADVEDIRAEFADEIGDRCARDRNSLLAGVVDRIVADLAETYL